MKKHFKTLCCDRVNKCFKYSKINLDKVRKKYRYTTGERSNWNGFIVILNTFNLSSTQTAAFSNTDLDHRIIWARKLFFEKSNDSFPWTFWENRVKIRNVSVYAAANRRIDQDTCYEVRIWKCQVLK